MKIYLISPFSYRGDAGVDEQMLFPYEVIFEIK